MLFVKCATQFQFLLCEASSIFHRQVRFLCTMHALSAYSTFGHHPHPQATLVWNCVSVMPSTAALLRGKNCVLNHSISHSVIHPAYSMCREPKLLLRNIQCGRQYCAWTVSWPDSVDWQSKPKEHKNTSVAARYTKVNQQFARIR